MERKVTSIIYNKDEAQLYKLAADTIEDAISDLLEKQDNVVFAIAGGRSVPFVFKILKDRKIDWSKIHIFMVDERMVPIDDKESNFKLAKDTFLDDIEIPKENLHPFIFDESSPDKGLGVYEEELKKVGGKYDVILLSAGEDGHVGALNPNHHSIEDDTEFFISMTDAPKPPPERMSMSKKLLLKSDTALVLIIGESKKQALKNFLDEKISYKECPAKLVQDIENSYALTNMDEE